VMGQLTDQLREMRGHRSSLLGKVWNFHETIGLFKTLHRPFYYLSIGLNAT
jgi:hypothetical protein